MRNIDYPRDAEKLLTEWGVQQLPEGVWAFTDIATASRAYVHHSAWPAALCAYAAVDPIFARGRFPGRTLIDLIHKVPSMDGAERTALAIACGAPAPDMTPHRSVVFGEAVWANVAHYDLDGVFVHVGAEHAPGAHYHLRPRGIDFAAPHRPVMPAELRSMRKAYRGLDPVRQAMALSILHLYLTRPDKHFLLGGCPTQILAADAFRCMQDDAGALASWGHMVSHYDSW